MPNARASHLTRRGILAAGGALGLGAALAACGDERLDKRAARARATPRSPAPGPSRTTAARPSSSTRPPRRTSSPSPASPPPSTTTASRSRASSARPRPRTASPTSRPATWTSTRSTILGNVYGRVQHRAVRGPRARAAHHQHVGRATTLWYVPRGRPRTRSLKLAPSVAVLGRTTARSPRPLQRHAGARRVPRRRHQGARRSPTPRPASRRPRPGCARPPRPSPTSRCSSAPRSQDLFYVSGPNLSADLGTSRRSA